jgi:hypothetical protein
VAITSPGGLESGEGNDNGKSLEMITIMIDIPTGREKVRIVRVRF